MKELGMYSNVLHALIEHLTTAYTYFRIKHSGSLQVTRQSVIILQAHVLRKSLLNLKILWQLLLTY